MKKLLSVLMISLILVLAACGNDEEGKTDKDENAQQMTMDKDEIVDNDKVVISINNDDVTGELYNPVYLQMKMRAFQNGQAYDDKEKMKEATLNQIISQELIKQQAEKQGIKVSDEDVQKEYDQFKSANEENFADYMKQYKLTEGVLKEQIRFSHLINQYVEKEIDVPDVTEEEIKAAYDNLKGEMDDMPDFDDAKTVIKEQLIQQRQAEALHVEVEKLKDTATIKKNI